MKKIKLTRDKWAIVDDTDYAELKNYKWHFIPGSSGVGGYALRHNGYRKPSVSMHRQILNLSRGDRKVVDHINGNGLDNRQENLRIGTTRSNGQNRHEHREGNLVGANKRKRGGYYSQVQINGKRIYLGSFSSAEEANAAYQKSLSTNV